MNDIPVRRAFSGQSYMMFESYNDIHLYVEDSGMEDLYIELLDSSGMKVAKVFSLNGKDSVIEKAEACQDRKVVYIVDCDWDDYHGNNPILPNLIILDKNCIESYLLNFTAFLKLVISEHPKKNMRTSFTEPKFNQILSTLWQTLLPLFECFLEIQASPNRTVNCSLPPSHFAQKNAIKSPDNNSIINFISGSNVVPSSSVKSYFSGNPIIKKGHGKYLLYFLWNEIKKTYNLNQCKTESLMVRLAQLSDSPDLVDLVNEIQSRATVA